MPSIPCIHEINTHELNTKTVRYFVIYWKLWEKLK
jgi:hypothetical protein